MAEINQEILKRTLVINVEDGTGATALPSIRRKTSTASRLTLHWTRCTRQVLPSAA